MRQYIARLMDTGMPRKVALCMCRHFRTLADLEKYVEGVEAECRAQMEAI